MVQRSSCRFLGCFTIMMVVLLFVQQSMIILVEGFHGILNPQQSYCSKTTSSKGSSHVLYMAVSTKSGGGGGGGTQQSIPSIVLPKKKKGYEPKWKKIATLVDKDGPKDFIEIGLKGTIPVLFKQGNETRKTVALPNQPLREVAIQAGQFIKYGCGKGECGTCECLVNGQWIRPCTAVVPSHLEMGSTEYTIQVKEIKNKASSSGKFYSVRSFLWGFYNNVLGMVGLVKYRKAAKQNYVERMEYEQLIKERTAEKKRMKEIIEKRT